MIGSRVNQKDGGVVMSRCYGIALIALLVGMPVAVWAGQADDTTVVTDSATAGDTQKQKRRGGHARLGNVEPGQASNGAEDVVTGIESSPSADLPSVSTTEGAAIE